MVEKYFVIRLLYFKSGDIQTTSEICNSKNQAMAKHYSYIGEDMENELLCGSSCTVLNQLGENVVANNWGTIVIE